MKYYSLKFKLWDDKIMDEESEGQKVYPQANGDTVVNNNGYLTTTGNFGKIYFENYVDDAPVFDYFYLYNLSYQKEYDWILLDAYSYIGKNVPSARGFLVSKRFKEVLEQFNIAKPYRFYESKLKYQGEKLTYYIFHLAQNEWKEFNLAKSSFFIKDEQLNVSITGNRDFKKLIKQHANLKMKIALNTFSDIFYFSKFGYVVSENLKVAIEKANLVDFDFFELEDVEFSFIDALA